jgi:hypothetical protein
MIYGTLDVVRSMHIDAFNIKPPVHEATAEDLWPHLRGVCASHKRVVTHDHQEQLPLAPQMSWPTTTANPGPRHFRHPLSLRYMYLFFFIARFLSIHVDAPSHVFIQLT